MDGVINVSTKYKNEMKKPDGSPNLVSYEVLSSDDEMWIDEDSISDSYGSDQTHYQDPDWIDWDPSTVPDIEDIWKYDK